LLSFFFVMKEALELPQFTDGRVWTLGPYRGLRFHRHDELELNFVLRGECRYLVKDRRYDLHRHGLLWLFPKQEHVLASCSPDFEMWIAVFKPALVRRVAGQSGQNMLGQGDPTGPLASILSREQGARLTALCAETRAAHELVQNSGDKAARMRQRAGFEFLLLSAWAAHQRAELVPTPGDVHSAVERAAYRIKQEAQGGAVHSDLAELARHAGLSPARLSSLFKSQMGLPLAEFRNRAKLEVFFRLYGSGQRTNILHAAFAAGFGSYPQFHRVFKAIHGMGPAEWKRTLMQD
jgi:AraC-like DNA-binding protein